MAPAPRTRDAKQRETLLEERRRDAEQDRTLLRLGVAAAVFAATAAGALTLAPGEPGLRGLQHLALFAQPARGRDQQPAPAPPPAAEAPDDQPPAPAPRFAAAATPSPRIAARPPAADEPLVVGALSDAASAALSGRVAATPLAGWRIYEMVGGRVLLAGPAGVAWVWPGVDLGEAGRVARIDVERDGVVVVTSKGAIRQRR